jgi:hypothetical protein
MKKNEAEFAFARPHSESEEFFFDAQAGMTLRDYFAAKAMQGFAACDEDFSSVQSVAINAYKWADAMMKAREA